MTGAEEKEGAREFLCPPRYISSETKMKARIYLIASALLLAALAAAETNIEIVFDSSASMSEQVDGQQKIEIAKDVVSDYLESVEDENVALRLYGHRTEQCTDTELVLPFGSDKSQINAAVQKMQPTGLTPIDYSLRQAARDLPKNQENFIILVSDGEETCGGDPCKAVKELRESGTNFVLYAIGFGINEAGKEQLKCMADAYYDASNIDELSSAFHKITKRLKTRLVVATKDPQAGTPAQKEEPLSGMFYALKIEIYDSSRTQPVNANIMNIFDTETGTGLDFERTYAYVNAGTYDIKVDYQDLWLKNIGPFWIDDAVVEDGKDNLVYAEVNTGKLTVTLYKNKAEETAGIGPSVYLCAGRSDTECVSQDFDHVLVQDSEGLLSTSPSFDLEPGVYNIYVSGAGCMLCPIGNVLFKGVEIEAGKETALDVCPAEDGTDECRGETGAVNPFNVDGTDVTIVDYGKTPVGGYHTITCGDGRCDAGETSLECPEDCLPGMLSVSIQDAISGSQINDASVQVMRKADSTIVAESITSDGTADFVGLPADKYYLVVQAAGYNEFDGSGDVIELTGEGTVSNAVSLEPISAEPNPGAKAGASTDALPLLLLGIGVVAVLAAAFFIMQKRGKSSGPVAPVKATEPENLNNEELRRLET